jgi:2,3-bisphosphoglycerate-dependent phosphoglycerate mutase
MPRPLSTWLLVVRHGETRWNIDGRIQGHRDSPLTVTGRAQAEALAARLAAEGVDALYSSDLGRARETAAPIAAATGLAPLFNATLRERAYGVFESFTWPEIEARYPEEYARLQTRNPAYAVPGGESALEFRERLLAAMADIADRHSGQRVVIVTHGGALGMLYRVASAMPLDAQRDYVLPNAALNRFAWRDGRIGLESWGDVAHLTTVHEAGVDSRDTI